MMGKDGRKKTLQVYSLRNGARKYITVVEVATKEASTEGEKQPMSSLSWAGALMEWHRWKHSANRPKS